MLTNYLKIAFRSLWKNKGQSVILIGGLAAGMSACMLLLQYVGYELSFDHFHSKADRIYRVVNERIQEGKRIQKGTITYPTIGDAMGRDFPEVANHTRLMAGGDVFIRVGEKLEEQEGFLWADEHFLEIFDFPVLAKNGTQLLGLPDEMVITRSVADAYFPWAKGDYQAIIGKELLVGAQGTVFRVSAVLDDVPHNSLLKFRVLGAFSHLIQERGKEAFESWNWSDFWHFLELKPGADAAALEAKFPAFSERYFQRSKESGSEEIFSLQALKDAHLYSRDLEYEIGETVNGRAVWSLLIVAFFILVIAWINYVNLSSVRAMERAREVGVRKAIGADRSQLIGQFMTEALLVNLTALALAFPLVQLIKPWFANNFDLEPEALQVFSGGNHLLWPVLAGLLVLGVLVSGVYPAWLLSASPVAGILKGFFQKQLGGGGLRKGLVVFQFTASIALITATWLVTQQIRYMNRQDLGIHLDHVITIDPPRMTQWDSTYISKVNAMKTALTAHAGIKAAASSNRAPGDPFLGRVFQINKVGEADANQNYTCGFINADFNYAETYGLKPLAGRFFLRTDHSPEWEKLESIVLSESAVKMFGYASNDAALGKTLRFWDHNWHIVGVLPDFHQKSLHHAIEPLVFVPSYSTSNKISLRLAGEQLDQTLALIQKTYLEFFPGNVFKYAFVEDNFQKLYLADIRFGNILGFFTLLTILIACLGLFGLASYTTMLRTKEIGIRKVLGASVTGITSLLASDFLKLVLLAILIAAPLAWYFMQQWLTDFAYRIEIQWWMFVVSGVVALGIAFVTVGFQSVKSALANPVQSLRNE
ncbi:MAG: ABC transporter permease [Saprospiraceae bacterium]|nr:ABC transporter permease [Saprospiraceae bacterium]